MAIAACAANSTSTSSSSSVNADAPCFSPRNQRPTVSARWRTGVPWKVFDGIRSAEKPSERANPGEVRQRLAPSGALRSRRVSVTPAWSPVSFTPASFPGPVRTTGRLVPRLPRAGVPVALDWVLRECTRRILNKVTSICIIYSIVVNIESVRLLRPTGRGMANMRCLALLFPGALPAGCAGSRRRSASIRSATVVHRRTMSGKNGTWRW